MRIYLIILHINALEFTTLQVQQQMQVGASCLAEESYLRHRIHDYQSRTYCATKQQVARVWSAEAVTQHGQTLACCPIIAI